jgi:hypothetical protein
VSVVFHTLGELRNLVSRELSEAPHACKKMVSTDVAVSSCGLWSAGPDRMGAPAKSKSGSSPRARPSRYSGSLGEKGPSRYADGNPKWTTNIAAKAKKKLSDELMQKAKQMFFSLDKDGSGTIDAEECAGRPRTLSRALPSSSPPREHPHTPEPSQGCMLAAWRRLPSL